MFSHSQTQRTLSETVVDDYLLTWMEAFMIDRQAQVAQGHATAPVVPHRCPRDIDTGGKTYSVVGRPSCSRLRVSKIINYCVHYVLD